MQDWRGKVFKIVIISMMVVIFLSMWLSSIMYLGWNKEATQTGQNLEENILTWEEFTWSLETWNLGWTWN